MQTGVNKKLAAGVLQVMITDGTHPTHADTTGSEKMLYSNIQRLIIQGNTFNNEYELSLISYMLQYNIHGNNETSQFDLYWKSLIRLMVTEIAHGAHERRHAAGDYDAINRISHATFMSTKHLIKSTIQLIKNNVLKKGVDLKVP